MASALQKIGAYARLLRLSNAPTAVADVWMGYAVSTGSFKPTVSLVLLTMVSLCLYHGGMALNDAVDAKQDGIDRRGRPIERRLISQRLAYLLAYALLAIGVAIAVFASQFTDYPVGSIAFFVAVCVIAYNSRLKLSLAGPFLMALCRIGNVEIGMSQCNGCSELLSAEEMGYYRVGLFFYVVGLTFFAREESVGKKAHNYLIATLMSFGGALAIGLLLGSSTLPPAIGVIQWGILWFAIAMFTTRGMLAATLQPTQHNIGRGIGIAIQGIIVIDATLAAIYAGPMAGLAIFALLPVTMLLSKWIPQT